ncbi:hydroxyacid dehydrogenase [Nonomuraea sp. TT08I-71]|nr:hydroxyacid dehydrogenase [Nonomuraea sp. TT08I-71]
MADDSYRQLFDDELRGRLAALARLGEPVQVAELESAAARARLAETEVLITGWGCPPLTAAVLDAAPRLRAVLHAAGSVKHHVTDACWRRGLLVTSAAEANAVPVAEYTLAAVLMAAKRTATFAAAYREHPGSWQPWRDAIGPASAYRRTVGIVGLSRIGRRVSTLLRPFDLTVLAHDPYATPEQAAAVGAELTGLDDMIRRSDILTVHAPDLPETRHLLDARRLALLPDHATVINTARGALVDTAALTAECVAGRLSAILDVTDPEPLPAGSPLYRLPNVMVTPHIAGAMHSEVHRLAASALDELARLNAGEPPHHQVRAEDLAVIA